ncbi:uncharacterized protein LOC117585386 [Drosophila guanche]|uniref:DUF4794 domain-containing protein n=1 Tax=Drosophila guanche TaxID=7266 RepID=A0A3B0KAI3_DROGU|nr:uncharacterized protein LOC117585386 [Drosophila guanche]SPP83099.1 Hypothetical predicted protein [Drosophila guanche]
MHWPLVTALLLFVAWSYPTQIESARTPALELQQILSQAHHPGRKDNYQYVLLPSTRGGYRRRQLTGYGKARSTTTTERPLVRVWNSFIRSVQPSFSLRNLTNPLANFFNDGSTNIIETTPVFLQAVDEDQELKLEEPIPEQQSSKKRKRKRRKQLKRRPSYDSQEYDDPYEYYAPPLPAPPAQPMFFYDTNSGSYYGVQRFSPQDFQPNYYNGFDPSPEIEPQEQPILGKINTKKITLLRPLPLSSPEVQSPVSTVDASDSANQSEEVVDDDSSSDSTPLADATTHSIGEGDNDAPKPAPLSESTRNALGTYMRDDQRSRQRQRHSERNGGVTTVSEAGAKVTPRHRKRYFLTARLVH